MLTAAMTAGEAATRLVIAASQSFHFPLSKHYVSQVTKATQLVLGLQ